MNFSRKTILVVGAALLAACGDKVTVQEYTPPAATPKVNSVEVSPASITLNVSQQATFTAAVNADAGLATTVTWTASAGTITSAGVFTAPATGNPGIAVCATSTVDTGKKGCAQVVVSPATTTIPATVTINGITANGNLNTTVNPAAVAGAIDVTLNVNPGNQTVQKVDLFLGDKLVGTQSFTAAQSGALRFAADEAIAAQVALPQIIMTTNTACYAGMSPYCTTLAGAAANLGTPVWTNQTYALKAVITASGGSAGTAQYASGSMQLTMNNADGWHAVWATTGTIANAMTLAGFRYDRGGLNLTAYPVIYTVGRSVAASTGTNISFGSAACDASAIGARSVALTAGTNNAWTATIAQTGTAGATNVNAYEFNGCAGFNATGESPRMSATDNAGNSLFTAAASLNTVAGIRLDNRAPQFVVGSSGVLRINQNPNSRANRWLNDDVVLNGVAQAAGATLALQSASNGFICGPVVGAFGLCLTTDTLPRDAGVGSAAVSVQVGATKTAATTAAAITSVAALDPTATNAGYCAIAYSADALGNKTASPSTATLCGAEANNALIGVDRYKPTIKYDATSMAANDRRSAGTIAGEFAVAVNDTGLVGNSGMLPTNPVLMLVSQRVAGAANSAGTVNPLFANGTANAAGTLSATGVNAAGIPVYTTAITGLTGAANHAYYTFNARAYDAAGNFAEVSPRVIVYDAAAPVPGTPSAPLTITALGYSATAFINEDLDIQDYAFNGVYTGAPVIAPAVIGQPWIAVNGWNAATFANTNYAVTTTVNLPLALQANVAAGLTNIASMSTTARSQSNLAATSGLFNFVSVTPGTAISVQTDATCITPAALGQCFQTFAAATVGPAAGITGVVTGNTTAASAGGTPLASSITVTAQATGTTAKFNNPFARVDFYMLDATGARYLLVGSASTPVLNDNGAVRTFDWSATLNGATVYSTLNGAGATWASQILAVGMKADGTIGMVNAGLKAINVVF